MRWRTNSTGRQQFCFLFLLLTIFGAFGQDGLGKSDDEQIGAIGLNPAEQQAFQRAQQRKDLNELPEMRKAKELRTEAERAEIEAERMRELAKLEAELKAKDEEMEATTEMAHTEPMETAKNAENAEKVGALNSSSNETLSSGERAEEVAPSSEIGTGGGMLGESGMEKEGGEGGNVEGAMRQETALGSGEPVGNNSSENGNGEHKEAVELIGITGAPEGRQGDAVTAIQFQQEALVTTHRASSSSSRPQGEEESAAADDPFQSSSTSAPSNGDRRIGGGEKPEEHEQPMGHEMEHEVIQQTVHVHQPQNGQGEGGGSSGGGGGGGEEAMKELAMPGMGGGSGEMGNGTTHGQQQTETLVSTEIGGQNEEKSKSGEESKENAEMHHEATVGQEEETSTISDGILHGIGEQQPSTPAHPMMEGETTTTMEPKREEGKEEEGERGGKLPEAEHEATEMPQPSKEDAEEHPIVFPAAHLPDDHEDQTQQPPTTEESSVIVGDKSVFEQEEKERKLPEPEKAKIQLMSHEGEPKESSNETERPEESQPSTPMPMAPHPSGPLVNEGSDGFELITKEEHGDAPPPSNGGGTSEKPEEAKEIGEEEAEVLPTPADETATQMPIEGGMGGGEAEHSGSMASTMATTTMVAGHQEEEHKMEGGMMGHEGMEGEATTMGGPVEQQTAEMEADTPPQRGDLPGMETSHPMESEMKTTTMGPEMGMSTQQEDKSANEVQEAESTSEAFPVPTTSMSPEQFEQAKSLAHRTPFSLRLPDIEWRPEFEDIESGAAKKLREQLDADLRAVLAAATGPTNPFVDFQFTGLRPGSVIVDGEMLTRDEVADPQAVVASLEQAILAKGGMLGGNAVDTDQLTVAGQMPAGSTSANNLMAAGQQKQQQQDATNTGLIIGGAVVVGVLIVVFAIFAIVVFGLNSRRNNCGSLKLSGGRREEICMVENGKGTGPFGGNGRRLFGSGGGGGTNLAINGIPSSADAAETGNGGVNLMSLRTTAGSNTPTLNGGGGHNNPNYGQQNGAARANGGGGGGGYANGTGSGARP